MGMTIPCEADDNTILSLDFGANLFAVAHGTAAGSHSNQFGAGTYFGTKGIIHGVLLDGEPFEFPGRELTLDAPVSDWDAQMRVLPHVKDMHWSIPEAHVFEDIMQLVDWIIDDTPTSVTAEQARHVIEIIESGYRAAETGEAQDLVTTFETPFGSEDRR
jgi:predicted dehydrogenase